MKTPITEDLDMACSTVHEQAEVLTGLEASFTKRLPGGFKESIIAQTQTLRNVEKHLNDLKKENFSLKLRIYFLEERIQQKYEDNREDIYRQNIELKVEVESLKQELQEKQQSLDKAWTEAENQSNKNEAEICHQPKNKHVCETLEKKIQTLQEEMQSAKTKAERMATLAEVEKKRCLELNRQLMELSKKQDEIKKSHALLLTKKDKKIEELIKNLKEKEQLLELQSTEEQNLLQCLEKPQEMKMQIYEELTCE